MVDALVCAPSEWAQAPYGVREGTRIALEERGLVETDVRQITIGDRLSAGRYTFWRRTVVGEDLATEIVMEREREAARA